MAIIPGMTVQADIKTGSKTILDYLLKPISRGFDSSFHER
jgi:multidrug efflux pump subunit AcrA (membrane-fusion protein)